MTEPSRVPAGSAREQERERALLEFAVSHASAIFYVADLRGDRPVRFISANVESITGHPQAAFLGDARFGRRHIHPEDLDGYRAGVEALHRAESLTQEYRLRAADGRWLWFRDEQRRAHAGDGAGAEFVGCMIDVTAEKAAEAARRESESRYRAIVENSPVCIHEVDLEGRILSMNPAGLRMIGLADESGIVGRRLVDLMRRSERGEIDALMRRAFAGETVEFEFSTGEAGAQRFFTSKIPMRGAGGRVERLLGIAVDITERKRREVELRHARETLEDALESLWEGFALLDADYRLITCNRRYRESNPLAAEMLVPGVDWFEFIRVATERGQFLEAIGCEDEWVEMVRGRLQSDGVSEFQIHDGRWYQVAYRRTRQGGTVITRHEITHRKQAEEQMARQRELLHKSEKLSAMGELLAGVAHELNNPLSVLVGQALLLEETAREPATVERAKKIGNAADRCARIVKAFLAMARQRPMQSRAVDLNEVVEAALEVTGYSLRASDVDVRLRLGRDLPPVGADADQLTQVLTNLVVNAQHALQEVSGPRRLKLTTSFRRKTREVVLKIKDNGPGIPRELRSRVFDPFFTTKDVGSGTGVGLAVSHRIVESHGGTIELEGPAEGETTFAIRLPACEPAAGAEAGGETAHVDAARLSALIVEDETDVAEMLADVLRTDGHEVAIASSGSGALERIGARDFDVILSDMRMPGLDGPGLYRALGERKPALLGSLAFITGDTMSPQVKRFLDRAGRPYIEKPITPDDVRALVRRVVGA